MQKTKKAKREEKKQSYFKSNFLTNESYLKQQPYDTTEIKNELDSKWNEILENKIKEIFPPNLINTNLLTRSLQHLINENKPKINKELIEINENEEENKNKDSHSEDKENENNNDKGNGNQDPKGSQSESDKAKEKERSQSELDKAKEKEKVKLLDDLKDKEKKYVDTLDDTKKLLEKLKQFENKQYNEIVNKEDNDEGRNDENKNIEEIKNDIIIKQRILNYTMRLNQFSLVKIVTFWKENIPKLKEQLKKDPNYKTNPQEKKNFNDKEITKQPKAVNVKHIYSEPSEEIRKMIPFCPKKFTIQKKDA